MHDRLLHNRFLPVIFKHWNHLWPDEIINAETAGDFKRLLNRINMSICILISILEIDFVRIYVLVGCSDLKAHPHEDTFWQCSLFLCTYMNMYRYFLSISDDVRNDSFFYSEGVDLNTVLHGHANFIKKTLAI